MITGEKPLEVEMRRLERRILPKKYCIAGLLIIVGKGPTSPEFERHVDICKQCKQALIAEAADVRQ